MAGLVGTMAVGLGVIAGMASKKKERPNQLPLLGALSAITVYCGWKLFSSRAPPADEDSAGNSNASSDIQSNMSSDVDEAGNRPENNTVLESLQEKDDRGEPGSAPFKEEQDGLFLSKSEGLNPSCNYLSTDDWKHYYSAISSDSPLTLPWSSHSSTLLNPDLVEGNDIALLGSPPHSDVVQWVDNGATRGLSKICSEADADIITVLSSSSLSSISFESSVENPLNSEGAINASPDLRVENPLSSEGAINASPDLRLDVYDEYLSDPCLSASMRSQVLRAKSIVQRLHKP